uniref:Uncharacterized protein n=1 Tax=Anopheles maculatus TaxID=74869 RepID=A0A182SNP0_9DIPT
MLHKKKRAIDTELERETKWFDKRTQQSQNNQILAPKSRITASDLGVREEAKEHPGLRGTPLAMLAAQCNKLSSKSPPPLADAAVGKGFHPWKKSPISSGPHSPSNTQSVGLGGGNGGNGSGSGVSSGGGGGGGGGGLGGNSVLQSSLGRLSSSGSSSTISPMANLTSR